MDMSKWQHGVPGACLESSAWLQAAVKLPLRLPCGAWPRAGDPSGACRASALASQSADALPKRNALCAQAH